MLLCRQRKTRWSRNRQVKEEKSSTFILRVFEIHKTHTKSEGSNHVQTLNSHGRRYNRSKFLIRLSKQNVTWTTQKNYLCVRNIYILWYTYSKSNSKGLPNLRFGERFPFRKISHSCNFTKWYKQFSVGTTIIFSSSKTKNTQVASVLQFLAKTISISSLKYTMPQRPSCQKSFQKI